MLYGYSNGRYFRLRWFPSPSNGWFNARPRASYTTPGTPAGTLSAGLPTGERPHPDQWGTGEAIGLAGSGSEPAHQFSEKQLPKCRACDLLGIRPTRDEFANKRFARCTIGKSTYA